jgi:threonyl-tRNA synthetase
MRFDGETQEKNTAIYKTRHSMAHVLAQAVQALFSDVKLGFGPPTETGLYYDFDFGSHTLEAADLKRIEKQVRRILEQEQTFVRLEMDGAAALAKVEQMTEPYKVLQVKKLSEGGETCFSFYQNGNFVDLCEGPHVESTQALRKAGFQLDRISGAYWLGNEKNKMLTRIYALCFSTPEELNQYLERRKNAEENDHKKLGRELDLFTVDDIVGKGLILWMPNGTVLRDTIENYAKEMEFHYGYQRVATPHITKEELFLKSQHLPEYQASMFPPMIVETEEGVKERFYLKPMNCPFHHTIYLSRPRSYRELPLRFAEYGTCYRFEQSGELSGLLRVRCMTMNDAHIYLAEENLDEEIKNILSLYQEFYKTFALSQYRYRLSVRGKENQDKFKGDPVLWDRAEAILKKILDAMGLPYYLGEGEAAFYGPKIDIQFENLMGREETLSTIQLDFLGPINFDLNYVSSTGELKRPVIIHRAPLSTHERFVSFLIEYYRGAFPTWMAPTQVMILPIADAFSEYCFALERELKKYFVRVKVDVSDNSFNKKIRTHSKQKIPILLIVGQQEVEKNQVTLRRYGIQEQQTKTQEAFISELKKEIETRKQV